MVNQVKNSKIYLITGGSSGIGLEVAKRLSQEEAKVILLSSSEKKLVEARKTLSGFGHMIYEYNLEDIKNIPNIFEWLKGMGIKLDGLIHCAGIAPLCLLKDNTPDMMEKVFGINVFSFIELVKNFQKAEISNDGSKIVAVGSITRQLSGYRQTLYGASKNAIVSIVKLMAPELLNRNITINCVSPGVTDTPMLIKLKENSSNLEEKIKKSQPLGIIPVENIAETILFLLSANADYITGKEWIYDGGALL